MKHIDLSKCFYALEQHEDAIQTLNYALEYVEQTENIDSEVIASLYASKADNLFSLGKYIDSLRNMNKAIKLHKYYVYLMYKGQILFRCGKYNKSIKWYKKSLEFHKEKSVIYMLIAQSERELYHYEEVIDLLNMALKYNSPDDVKYQDIVCRCEELKLICAEKLLQYPDGNYPIEKDKPMLKTFSIEEQFSK